MKSPWSTGIYIVSDSVGNCYNASGKTKNTFLQDLRKLPGDPWSRIQVTVISGMTLAMAADKVAQIREDWLQQQQPLSELTLLVIWNY